MAGAIEFHATCHTDNMQIDVTVNEVLEDGTIVEIRKGTILNEDAVHGIMFLARIKRLVPA